MLHFLRLRSNAKGDHNFSPKINQGNELRNTFEFCLLCEPGRSPARFIPRSTKKFGGFKTKIARNGVKY